MILSRAYSTQYLSQQLNDKLTVQSMSKHVQQRSISPSMSHSSLTIPNTDIEQSDSISEYQFDISDFITAIHLQNGLFLVSESDSLRLVDRTMVTLNQIAGKGPFDQMVLCDNFIYMFKDQTIYKLDTQLKQHVSIVQPFDSLISMFGKVCSHNAKLFAVDDQLYLHINNNYVYTIFGDYVCSLQGQVVQHPGCSPKLIRTSIKFNESKIFEIDNLETPKCIFKGNAILKQKQFLNNLIFQMNDCGSEQIHILNLSTNQIVLSSSQEWNGIEETIFRSLDINQIPRCTPCGVQVLLNFNTVLKNAQNQIDYQVQKRDSQFCACKSILLQQQYNAVVRNCIDRTTALCDKFVGQTNYNDQ
ncbi:Hypothetical_protein [Hexamita inflata]|uniref:Hypothetical_protein n=1 Tax=Hexamita inflata TaxID=28002 RepID=A0AA86Q6Y1_9EUKA|nr:Hypothetical protein HINF_LOCUS34689 [Hexamita inflata]